MHLARRLIILGLIDKLIRNTGDFIQRSTYIYLIGLAQYTSLDIQDFLFFYVFAPLAITLITAGRYVSLAQYSVGESFSRVAARILQFWPIILLVILLLVSVRLLFAQDIHARVVIDLAIYFLATLASRFYIEHLRVSKKNTELSGYFWACLYVFIAVLILSFWVNAIELILFASVVFLCIPLYQILCIAKREALSKSANLAVSDRLAAEGQNVFLLASFLTFFVFRNVEKIVIEVSGFPHIQEYLICCVWGSYFVTIINQTNNILFPRLLSKIREGSVIDIWSLFGTRVLKGAPILLISSVPFFFLFLYFVQFLKVTSFNNFELLSIFSAFLVLGVLQLVSPYMNLSKQTIGMRVVVSLAAFALSLSIIFLPGQNSFVYYPLGFNALSLLLLLFAIFWKRPTVSSRDY